MKFGDGQPRNAGWRKSAFWRNNRRVVRLGAFAKWAEEHPEEHKAVEERFAREVAAGFDTLRGRA